MIYGVFLVIRRIPTPLLPTFIRLYNFSPRPFCGCDYVVGFQIMSLYLESSRLFSIHYSHPLFMGLSLIPVTVSKPIADEDIFTRQHGGDCKPLRTSIKGNTFDSTSSTMVVDHPFLVPTMICRILCFPSEVVVS